MTTNMSPYYFNTGIYCDLVDYENTRITRTGTNYIPIFLSNPITVKFLTVISLTWNNNFYIPN